MKKELDDKITTKYPEIFKDRFLNKRETPIPWGFSCGDGWYNIIDILCNLITNEYRQAKCEYNKIKDLVGEPRWTGSEVLVIQEEIDRTKEKMEHELSHVPTAVQVKEKFGGLRFYANGVSEKHRNYIEFTEMMSYVTCERCGAPGKTYTDGWHKTLCDVHAALDNRSDKNE